MKIRYGHVSNSSTSSFFGVGVELGSEVVIQEKYMTDAIKELLEDGGNLDDLTYTSPEIAALFKENKIEVAVPDYEAYIYCSYVDMREDETKAQFKERIARVLNEVFVLNNPKIGHVEAAWYNG
jgi:hypothetical protein